MGETDNGKALNELYPEAFLCGVLHGDGWCTERAIGLRVADYEFSAAFADALRHVFSVGVYPHKDERGYWLVRARNTTGKYSALLSFEPQLCGEMAAWVRGLFDSEGNACLYLKKANSQSYGRGISLFSTTISTLERAARYLTCLQIPTYLYPRALSAGHKGSQTVYRLSVAGSYEHYLRFAERVGSTIPRKQHVLDAIPQSYQPDNSYLQKAQAKGAHTRHRRTLEVTIPSVIAQIRALIDEGEKPTYKRCVTLPGYPTARQYFRHCELVAQAYEMELTSEHANSPEH